VGEKIWYLGSSKKTLGPMDSGRIRRYIAAGKTSNKTRIRKEGEEQWKPLSEAFHFRESLRHTKLSEEEVELDSAISDEAEGSPIDRNAETMVNREGIQVEQSYGSPIDHMTEEAEQPEQPKQIKKRKKRKKRSGVGPKKSGGFFASLLAGTPPTTYIQPYRIEKRDLWQSFSLSLDYDRCRIAYIGLLVSGLLGAIAGGVALGAMSVQPLLGSIFGLGAAGILLSALNMSLGALAYHARCRLGGEESPTVKEALSFALEHVMTLAALPFGMTLLPIVPIVFLALGGLVLWVPYIGPVVTGLLFVIHIILAIITFLCVLAGSLSWVLCPVIVGFEGTGVKDTMKVLFSFVRSSLVRFFFKGFWPGLAMLGFTIAVYAIGSAMLSPTAIVALVGMTKMGAGNALTVGSFFAGIWLFLFAMILVSVIVSAQNELLCRLYIAVRPDNEDLISRDNYLLSQQSDQ
jgi:hypothetical protein